MEKYIEEYNPTIIQNTFGTIEDNILNTYQIYVINLKKDIYRRSYMLCLLKKLKINHTIVVVNKVVYSNVSKIQNNKLIIRISLFY